jgi:hypothetical protein
MMVSEGEMYCLELEKTEMTLVKGCKALKMANRGVIGR